MAELVAEFERADGEGAEPGVSVVRSGRVPLDHALCTLLESGGHLLADTGRHASSQAMFRAAGHARRAVGFGGAVARALAELAGAGR